MKNAYSVGQVNRYVKNMFTQDFFLQKIYVKGEVSNCKYHTSGHIYFSLKDETGTMSCVMFAGHRRGLAFSMKDGDKVIVGGSVDVYERDGRYQLYAKEITLEGAGALYERYLALKQELEEMGMFAGEYKQPIPKFIRRLGVVTAPTGAAVQDIRNISYRRNPYLQIILYPALVQGADAAESIVKGIRMLDRLNVDVIIVGRGGGSIEDLWAFNEEIVARAAKAGVTGYLVKPIDRSKLLPTIEVAYAQSCRLRESRQAAEEARRSSKKTGQFTRPREFLRSSSTAPIPRLMKRCASLR